MTMPPHTTGDATGAAHVAACLASTMDGRLAHPAIRDLGSDADRRRLEWLRAQADLLLYGAGTARADARRRIEFRWPEIGRYAQARRAWGVPPMAVVARRIDFDFGNPFWHTPTRRLLVHVGDSDAIDVEASCPPQPGSGTHDARPASLPPEIDYLRVFERTGSGQLCMRAVLRHVATWLDLGDRLPRVLCEGGGILTGVLLRQDALDELFLTLTGWVSGDVEARSDTPMTVSGIVGPRQLALISADVNAATSEVFLRYRAAGRSSWPITEEP